MRLTAAILFCFLLLAVWNWTERDQPEPIPPPFPDKVVEIGTNDLPAGTLVFVPDHRRFFGEVAAVEVAHRFDDGTTRPGVKIKRGHSESWVPREKLGKMVRAKEETRP